MLMLLRYRTVFLTVVCFSSVLSGSCLAHGQSVVPASTFISSVTFNVPNYDHSFMWPMNIVRITVDGHQIAIDKPAMLSGLWLDKVVVVAKNTSSKTITEAGLTLTLPETGRGTSDSPVLSVQLHLGVYPDSALVRRDGTVVSRSDLPHQDSVSIPPGTEVQFLFATYGETLQTATSIAGAITKVKLQFAPIYFSDLSKWSSGSYALPTTSSNTWRTVTPAEFEQSAKK